MTLYELASAFLLYGWTIYAVVVGVVVAVGFARVVKSAVTEVRHYRAKRSVYRFNSGHSR